MDSTIKPFLQDIGAAAYELGYEVYIVGGYVRNKLYEDFYHKKLYLKSEDIDLVINTNAITFAYQLQKYLEDNHPQHLTFDIVEEFPGFGTIKIKHPEYPNHLIELASTREESYPEPADFPKVKIIDSIQDDLERRDFTINALLLSIMPHKYKHPWGEIVDYVGGLDDLKKGLVRVFHDYSLIDDPTRIYRAIRFAYEYNFKIEEHTLDLLIKATKHEDFSLWLKKRASRFKIELDRIKALPRADEAMEFLGRYVKEV